MKYKIKTPYGWQPFDKVVKKGVQKTLKITLNNGHTLCCTPDHLIYVSLFLDSLKNGSSKKPPNISKSFFLGINIIYIIFLSNCVEPFLGSA